MSDVVIRVENLYKQYRLGTISTGTILHDLNRFWYRVRGKEDPYLKIGEENDRTRKGKGEYVWALQDINFEVKRGEAIAIIGRNGAGKSTLLKILSKTTSPTTGNIKIKGRIASLLEVGTGFHPELSGRENIFLNGAILGMTKAEIKSKFDEIVNFAGVERYIDTPVKRYSSGMYVRLAFGVAAHLEPEILIVDEVLAVGDAEFQKKALGKMKDVSSREGRTVLFVSHNMAAIQNLCEKALLLSAGKVKKQGAVDDVITHYLNDYFENMASSTIKERQDRTGNGNIRFESAFFETNNGKRIDVLHSGIDCFLVIEIVNTTDKYLEDIILAVGIDDSQTRRLTLFSNDLTNQKISMKPNERLMAKIKIMSLPLQSDTYYFTLFCTVKGEIADWVMQAGKFFVESGDYYKTGRIIQKGQGSILIDHEFNF